MTEEREKTLWDEALVVLDTNSICAMYRMTKDTQKTMLEILKYLKDKLWIPGHVLYEYQKNRMEDCEGNVSEQIDIIIYDALYTPFVFNKDGVKLIPAESVYAVFEAKQDAAQNDNIKYAGQKVETVRRLKRTSTKIVNAGVTTKARNLTKIIGGILALEYSSKQETLEKHLKSLKGLQSLDCGCFLKNFAFDCKYEGKEDIVGREQVNVEDYYNGRSCKEVIFNSEENLLFAFFFQLNSYLKKIGTIPAIDINAYLQTIGVTVDEE